MTAPELTVVTLAFTVLGAPSAQGSKRHVGNGRMVDMNANLQPWRDSITYAARSARHGRHDFNAPLFTGPVRAELTFVFPRPKAHYRTGKHAYQLRDDAPLYKVSSPDVDKLVRAAFDAITASGVWRDDSQGAVLEAHKIYGAQPRLEVRLTALDEAAA